MRNVSDRDVARQATVVVAAVFHVLAGFLLAPELSSENYTLIQPATYAFFVWAPIFLLTLAYERLARRGPPYAGVRIYPPDVGTGFRMGRMPEQRRERCPSCRLR